VNDLLPATQTRPTAMVGFEPSTWQEAALLAETLAKSSIIPDYLKGKPGDVLVILMMGRELGLGPMQSLRMIHVIKGKPGLSADLVVGLCLKSPVCDHFTLVSSSDTEATYEAMRKGALGPTRLSFTMEDAKRAGLATNDNYRRIPAPMLRARCATALARVVFPDIVGNLYDKEELDPSLAEGAAPTRTRKPKEEPKAEVVEQAPPAPPETKAADVEIITPKATPIGETVAAIVEEPQSKVAAAPTPAPSGERKNWRGLTLKEWQGLTEDQRTQAGDISRKQAKTILDLAKTKGITDPALVVSALREDFTSEFQEWGVTDLWQVDKKVASYAIDSLKSAPF
jgi:hypothetical protein